MENQTQQQNFVQQPLPNSTAILVLGILSIALCWCVGVVGITLSIIALIMSGKAIALYNSNPNLYSTGSFNNAKAGKVCAIIGLCLSSLYLIYVIVVFLIWGAAFSLIPFMAL